MIEDSRAFQELLLLSHSHLNEDTRRRISFFRDLIVAENEIQNLTRLTTPVQFLHGHVEDCLALLSSGFMKDTVMDLGSGCGVPGILTALISGGHHWIVVESEARKAAFLKSAIESLGLESLVRSYSGRAEDYLENYSVDSIVVRAVGPVDRIYTWIRDCSTWNNLVLLKGPGWNQEWREAKYTKAGKELKISSVYDYSVGEDNKTRVIVNLTRV